MAPERRFLLATPVLPWPPNQGNKRFLLETARTLRALGPVTLLTRHVDEPEEALAALRAEGLELLLDEGYARRDPLSRLGRRLGSELRARLAGRPRELFFAASPGIRRRASAWQRRWPDGISVAAFWYMAPALLGAPRGRRILLLSDVEHARAEEGRRLGDETIPAATIRSLAKAEVEAFCGADLVFCLSGDDLQRVRKALREAGRPEPPLALWPATVPVAEACPPARRRGDAEPLRLSIYGHWQAAFNRDGLESWVREVAPAVAARRPRSVLRVAGSGLPEELIARMRGHGIEILGWVDDVPGELAQCDVVLIPLRYAGGLRYRMLEAMAHGRPTICTPVAASGSGAVAGRHYLEASSPEDWMRALDDLEDAGRARALAVDAHRFVQETYARSAAPARLEDALRQLDGSTAHRGG